MDNISGIKAMIYENKLVLTVVMIIVLYISITFNLRNARNKNKNSDRSWVGQISSDEFDSQGRSVTQEELHKLEKSEQF